jgi:hypothetical protein
VTEGDGRVSFVATALRHLELDVADLWLRYVGLGGSAPLGELRGWLDSELPMGDHDYDVLAHALNEAFIDRDQGRPVPYAFER